jgi:tetratricopeptide (TPR) repeat protein
MVDPDRRPTAQEIEELIDLVRRDPTSPAFIDLGEAYLSLGRPRDAIQVGNLGLEASPDNLEGRVMLARAHAAMHQWKEAQGELLRVVKVDRSNRQGFALLGEVLLRRSDYERAVPVLQHAQNLDPTSPQILAMLRRARAGQPLDPPNPLPQPIPPRGETDNGGEIQRSARANPVPAPLKRGPPPMVPAAAPMVPTMAIEPYPPQPAYAPPPPRGPKQTAPPPMSVEGIKPRIINTAKPQNAAAASLRQSAAVGETYLNDLLTGGLLDVAGVRVPDVDYDLRPDRRWGRSTRRAFIFLFVVLVLGIGGGSTWYWWAEKQKSEAVAGGHRKAKEALGTGDYSGFVEALRNLQQARDKDPSEQLTLAYFAETGGLAVLLYGEVRIASPDDPTQEFLVGPDQVSNAYTQVTQGADAIQTGEEGSRELLIGKAALELSRLPQGSAKPEAIKAGVEQLAEVNKVLDAVLQANPEDKWARWLKGRALLAAGNRRDAASAFKQAADGVDGLVVARIDQANLLVDDGRTSDALELFKKILAMPEAKTHMLAILGQSIARAEASVEVDAAIDDLAAKFGAIEKLPSRLTAYRWLALADVLITIDDYKGAADALTKAYLGKSIAKHPISEPRFWARVAWLHYKLGRPAKPEEQLKSDLNSAADALQNCISFGKSAEPDPTVQLVDAGLALASGLPEKVLDIAAKLEGVRPKLLRTYALIDLGKPKDAVALAEEMLKAAGDVTNSPCERDQKNKKLHFEIKALCEQALMLSSEKDKERLKASEALNNLASANDNQMPRHVLGQTLLQFKSSPPIDPANGSNLEYAKKSLKKAVDDITNERPNPLVYRTLTALAEIALLEKNIEAAGKTLDRALEANSGYFPTLALQARIVLRNQEPEKALGLLEPIMKESAAITPSLQLTYVEALILRKTTSQKDKDKDKEQAKRILTELKDKPGVSLEEIGRLAALIDDKLPEELGVPGVEAPDKPVEKKPPPNRRRRGR